MCPNPPHRREQNYFKGLEIYFRGTNIYFQAFEIYFRTTEKVLFRGARKNVPRIDEKYTVNRRRMYRESTKNILWIDERCTAGREISSHETRRFITKCWHTINIYCCPGKSTSDAFPICVFPFDAFPRTAIINIVRQQIISVKSVSIRCCVLCYL